MPQLIFGLIALGVLVYIPMMLIEMTRAFVRAFALIFTWQFGLMIIITLMVIGFFTQGD